MTEIIRPSRLPRRVAAALAVALTVAVAPPAEACGHRAPAPRIEHVTAVCQPGAVPMSLVGYDAVVPRGQTVTMTIEVDRVAIATRAGVDQYSQTTHISAFADPYARLTLRVVTTDGATVTRHIVAPSCRLWWPRWWGISHRQ